MEKQFFEILMLVCFGAAWPFSIHKSFVSRSTAGKSVVFLWVVVFGYCAGIINKLVNNTIQVVFFFYVIDLVMVATDLVLYYRNQRVEKCAL